MSLNGECELRCVFTSGFTTTLLAVQICESPSEAYRQLQNYLDTLTLQGLTLQFASLVFTGVEMCLIDHVTSVHDSPSFGVEPEQMLRRGVASFAHAVDAKDPQK